MALLSVLLEMSAAALAPIGAGIAVIGAAIGIGKIGASAMDAIGRQPEASGKIFTPLLIVAAFIEGVALFAVAVCLMALS